MIDDVGEDWFAFRDDADAGEPGAFLYLPVDDVERYLQAMRPEDVAGVFGPEVSLAEARYRLALVHVEENLLSHHSGIRYVVLDGEEIRIFDTSAPADPPAGNYQWNA
ncbi:hypothetical protein D2L64_17235 [Micromonospora radicis]|uniref:Uncharacterized protein n=1 Tax=Micromonospora radicis TaxID=1894971 RepID=A0A418MSH5_9ACTN|nr:hypothetical protein D2L64_17235 [Micromonospora radicis]